MSHPLQDNAEAPVKDLDLDDIARRKIKKMDMEMQMFPVCETF